MKIKVDYEECKNCEEQQDCTLLKAMQEVVDETVEILRGMTPKEHLPTHADEVHT